MSNWGFVRHPKFHWNEVMSWGEAELKGKSLKSLVCNFVDLVYGQVFTTSGRSVMQ